MYKKRGIHRHGKHDLSGHPLYSMWLNMKQRCTNHKAHAFKDYGGRGIVVCDRWAKSFPAFVQDMGERPAGFTIERRDNNGNYEPANCAWVSRKDQMLNRRNTSKLVIEGVEYKAAILSELSGLKTDTIIERAQKCTTLQEVLDPTRRIFWKGLAMTPNNRQKTHCKSGHEFTDANTYWTTAGYRQCRTCNYGRTKKYRSKS